MNTNIVIFVLHLFQISPTKVLKRNEIFNDSLSKVL